MDDIRERIDKVLAAMPVEGTNQVHDDQAANVQSSDSEDRQLIVTLKRLAEGELDDSERFLELVLNLYKSKKALEKEAATERKRREINEKYMYMSYVPEWENEFEEILAIKGENEELKRENESLYTKILEQRNLLMEETERCDLLKEKQKEIEKQMEVLQVEETRVKQIEEAVKDLELIVVQAKVVLEEKTKVIDKANKQFQEQLTQSDAFARRLCSW